jgi:hypothetical protein
MKRKDTIPKIPVGPESLHSPMKVVPTQQVSTSELAELIEQMCEQMQEIHRMISVIAADTLCFGEWITEAQARAITGLKKTSLYRLRADGKIIGSTIAGKGVFYLRSSFEQLLNENKGK